ncbi:DUF6361 family protein [Microlunatus capsulatus]|uniref:Uncharacterized protein n=1 Tax=Microlunatus capsulatus TaxID=99117 RepID=A0ABS4Z7X4_9ACTN|nr:DUF6361 family protein [Microlunatus capsulatus]MBP2416880.1 hypothetical protein [Microlunatus capsulatus]
MSFVAWLDHSTEDERRVREMIRSFDQPETQDALGFGQVRDAYGDLLFPGTSTLHTRAKYLLFIPWCSIAAAGRGYTGERLERASRDNERRLIQTLSSIPGVHGLIGGRRGWTVRNLPSGTYRTALERWHIQGDNDQDIPSPDDGELVVATHGWHRRLPAPPLDFPERAPGAFALTYGEAEYLQGRLLSIDGPPSLFAYLADHCGRALEAPRLWKEPIVEQAPPHIRDDVQLAETFSTIAHGANLLYNYLVARKYEQDGWTTVENPVERYEARLDDWAVKLRELGPSWPSWRDIRTRAADENGNVLRNVSLNAFAEAWFSLVAQEEPHDLWRSDAAQTLVRSREVSIKRLQSRFTNPTMLSRWGGSSGAGAFEFRWSQARQLLNDVIAGLRSDDVAVA